MINSLLAADVLRIMGCPLEDDVRLTELIRLTGSREEFLAHLIVIRRIFAGAPHIESALLDEARKSGQALTKRPPISADPLRAEASRMRLEAVEDSLMSIPQIAGAQALELEAAWHDYAAERPAADFELQYMIGRQSSKGG